MGYYRYNGVTLDALPEWDESAYPNAYIMESSLGSGTYALHVSASKLHLNASDYGEMMWEIDASPRLIYSFDTSTWNESISMSQGAYEIDRLLWTNYDILGDDGETVLFAASDPVPVEEDEPKRISLDPTALLMGWMVGKRVAGLRKTQTDVPVVPDEPDEPSGEPIAYLYPSVVLPDIESVWTDKETYPHAALFAGNGMCGLCLSDLPLLYQSRNYYIAGTNVIMYVCVTDESVAESAGVVFNEWFKSMEEKLENHLYQTGVFWANHDIVDDAGNPISAFTPVPTSDGMVCYKGAVLPDINEVWTDKETYKYALITVGYDSAHTADYYELFLSDQPVTARAYDTGDASYLNNSGATMNCLRFVLNGNAWGEHPTDYNSTLSNGKFKSGSGTFLYANYDVLKKADGTTYLAASEPVPVYE